MDEIERLYDQAVTVKNQIVRANLRLVVSIAKRHVGPTDNFFELVSDGNMSLIRAAEKFDYARGNKFSTYASWAIMKNFARTIPDELQAARSFPHEPSRKCSEQRPMAGPISTARNRHNRHASFADWQDSGQARRSRAEDHHQPFRTGSLTGATDFERSGLRNGRDQGTRATDRSPSIGKTPPGGPRGKD